MTTGGADIIEPSGIAAAAEKNRQQFPHTGEIIAVFRLIAGFCLKGNDMFHL